MRGRHRAMWGLLLATAGLMTAPVAAQDVATPAVQEAPAAQAGAAADAQAPVQTTQQAGQGPSRGRMSAAEKAAAVTGAVAAGVVAFKGLSALFKKKPAEAAAPTN